MLERIITEDGSHTLLNTELKEHYHSTHGAIQESKHVFIEAGLKEVLKNKKEIRLLEVGFGTGLNAFLTFLEKGYDKLEYISLEAFPITLALAKELNYAEQLQAQEHQQFFDSLHRCEWGTAYTLGKNFIFEKIKVSVQEYSSSEKFDLIYFDAFAPNVQPELWTAGIFKKMHELLNEGGILVTYCAKGEVKRNMKAAGFFIEALPGPPGKREMTRAKKVIGH